MQFLIEHFLFKVLKSPKVTVAVISALVIILATGIRQLEISNDFRVYLSQENPQLKAFEEFEADYVKSDNATFVVTAKTGDLFTQKGLKLIQALTEEAWLIDYAYRVSSLTNHIITRSKDDEITSNYLLDDTLEGTAELSEKKLNDLRRLALSEKRIINRLLTQDGKLGLIVVNLHLPENQPNVSLKLTEKVELIRDRYRESYPEFDIDNGGSTAFNATLARAVANDLSMLLPVSYFVIFIALFLFIRSVVGTVVIFILVTLCLLSTFGFWGWVAPVLTPIAGFAPSILLSIIIADSVHILVTYLQQRQEYQVDKKLAVLTSIKINFIPIFITSVTTMVGFLSLNFSASPPYQDLGNMVAIGVLLAFTLSLTLLPALLVLLPENLIKIDQKSSRRKVVGSHFFELFAKWVITQRKRLLISLSLITVILMLFIPNNKMSDNWANYFDDSFELVRLVQRIDGYLTGINTLEYTLRSKLPGEVFNPQYLQQLDAFEQWFMQQQKVVNVNSFSQLMRELNQVMHGDQQQWYRIPESSQLAAQYLLFYEFGLPVGLGLNHQLTIHKTASRFSVSVTNAGSDELLKLDEKANRWLQKNAPGIELTQATGLGMVFAHIAQRNITSLLMGTLVALIGVSIILMMVLKSFKYGLISLIPNIIPAAMAYGLWGMTFAYVDISLSIVACATLGIVVDDTVHFLYKYKRARYSGLDAKAAVTESFRQVGMALLTTSVVLASGFMILAISHMNTSATIGILMAITLLIALVVDFLLLPALLILVDKKDYLKNKSGVMEHR